MGIAGSLMTISICWWLAFFVLLPFGIRSQLEDGEVVQGTEPSAPNAPRLLRKAIWAFVIAIILWGALFVLINYDLVALEDIPLPTGIKW